MLTMVLVGLLLWTGTALLLAELRWFSRRTLAVRLGPYLPGGMGVSSEANLLSVESFREAIGPLARGLGSRFARIFGVREELGRRLARVHSSIDVTEFRVRQVGWSFAGFGIGGLFAVAIDPPAVLIAGFVIGGMLLAFLILERQVTAASERWQQAVRLELPVTAEQIAMLLASGYSLFGAIDRVSRRGRGSIASDLRRVCGRVRQGVPEEVALREWAELADVSSIDRLVAVLALNREASDLGRLIAEEARSIRRDVQRDLLELIERRGQQVWIPVTVATLLPGAMFIGIPFTAALNDFLG